MFRRPIVRYGATPEPETPYQRAGQVWDDRIGSARVQAKNCLMRRCFPFRCKQDGPRLVNIIGS